MTLKLITFDVTGTILQLREAVGSQYAKIATKYNVNASPDMLTKQFFIVFKELLAKHPNFGSTNIGWQEWWRQLVDTVFRNALQGNAPIEPSTLQKISSDLIEVYSTKECWKLTDGAQQLLDKLSSKGIHLGVISNYDPRLGVILKELNVRNHFDFVLASYTANCTKPDSAIFELVENMNVGIKKNEILHIGDNPRLDFMGAKNVGWNALLVAKNSAVLDEFPSIEKEWVVESISEVYETLENKQLV